MGAVVSVLLAGALPGRIERLALIDDPIPYTGEADKAPQKLGETLKVQLALRHKCEPAYVELEKAVKARMRRIGEISWETAELLAQRGLEPVPGGYTWRTDACLTLPSPLRLTRAHALNFACSVECPVSLVLAEQGMLAVEPRMWALLETLPFEWHRPPGGYHLHLDDKAGVQAVTRVFAAPLAR